MTATERLYSEIKSSPIIQTRTLYTLLKTCKNIVRNGIMCETILINYFVIRYTSDNSLI